MSMAAEHPGFDAHSALPSKREVAGWATAALVVLTLHAVVAAAFQYMQNDDPTGPQEAAMVVELAPLPFVAPSEVESDVIPEEVSPEISDAVDGVETISEETETATIEQDTVDPIEETPAEQAEPVVDEVSEAEPEVAEPAITEPEVAEAVTPEVAVPLPTPRPRENPKPAEPRKAEKPQPVKKVAKAKPAEKIADKQVERQAKAATAPAPSTAAAPSVSPARWQAKVLAWINRHKPRSARGRGTVQVSFSIGPSGDVLSAKVQRSSGDSDLDRAAIDMVMRSSPVPAPPPEIARARMNLSLPVQFSIR